MTLRLREILANKNDSLVTIDPTRTLRAAAKRLCDFRIGALPVVGSRGELVGIISERDLLRHTVLQTDFDRAHVQDAMTRKIRIALEDDDLEYAMDTMTEARIRHLPVMRDQRVIGIVSIGDVVNALRTENVQEIRYLNEYIHGPHWQPSL